jgi:hypothetical protein
MNKPKLTVIYRMIRGEVAAFLPDLQAGFGCMVTYHHIGQHGEADMQYYYLGRLATEEEYRSLHQELTRIYNDCELVIRKRVNYDKLTKMWWAKHP